jgi:hypothetical protein
VQVRGRTGFVRVAKVFLFTIKRMLAVMYMWILLIGQSGTLFDEISACTRRVEIVVIREKRSGIDRRAVLL